MQVNDIKRTRAYTDFIKYADENEIELREYHKLTQCTRSGKLYLPL